MALNENSRQQPLKYLAASNRVSVLNLFKPNISVTFFAAFEFAELLISFVGRSRAFQMCLFINFVPAKITLRNSLATSLGAPEVNDTRFSLLSFFLFFLHDVPSFPVLSENFPLHVLMEILQLEHPPASNNV